MSNEKLSAQDLESLCDMIECLNELKRHTLGAFTELNTMHTRLVQALTWPRAAALDVVAPMADELISIQARLMEGVK